MRRTALVAILTLAAGLALGPVQATAESLPAGCSAAPGEILCTGTFADGALYKVEVPQGWNGTLLLYSHGYVLPGLPYLPAPLPNPATDVGDAITGAWALTHGYALAGSSYAARGWALQEAFSDQISVLDWFQSNFGTPARTIAWGHSLGGIITAGLLQRNPERFSGGLPMCGVVAGGVGTWNQALDSAFAVKTLLAGSAPLQIVGISSPLANLSLAESILTTAQSTPQGRARLALAAALGDTPGWFDRASPEPDPTDFVARELNQFLWLSGVDALFIFDLRAELEARAGGNPSWNTDVNYRVQLAHSIDADEVEALYQKAGLDLDADLGALNASPRISADPSAVDYLKKYIAFNGEISAPVLTMHTTGDGLVVDNDESAYAAAVRTAGNQSQLSQVYVHRAGHCTFTPAETVAALQTLVYRLDTGRWDGSTDPATMNAAASSLGLTFNPAPASFFDFRPAPFLRPFNLQE
jgi:dienelactone hydrolase